MKALVEVAVGATYGAGLCGGVALAVTDVRMKRLPNSITLPLYAIGIVGLGIASIAGHTGGRMMVALIASCAMFLSFCAISLSGGLGFGDVKLAGVLGLYLGWLSYQAVITGLVFGLLLGLVFALGLIIVRGIQGRPWRKTRIAFGPFLIAGAAAAATIAATH